MEPFVHVAGALLILIAFMGAQLGRLDPNPRRYLGLNLVGWVVLTVLALVERQWGFLLLESVWGVVSAWGLLQVMRGRSPASAH